MTSPVAAASVLATRRGKLILALLCAIGFLDFVDASIVNIALPSIKADLKFSVQNLQWVISGYLLTYGGFMLLGGRAADLIGRRRVLLAGTLVFGIASLTGGLAVNAGMLVGARLMQGVAAAMMVPAALSILTSTFKDGRDRATALGAWGAMGGLASAVGVVLGGLLTEGPGWRWVLFVNPPICVVLLAATYRLIEAERHHARLANFDLPGAILATGGLLLVVFALVKAPDVGWGAARTIAELAGAFALLVGFVINEARSKNALAPLSIFRVRGLSAANATQLIAAAGFLSTFFFLSLYTQNILRYSPIKTAVAYLPLCGGVIVAAGIASQLLTRIGTRPLMVVGSLVAGGGVLMLSRLPVHGTYAADLLPGTLVMSVGLGAMFVAVVTAANAGVAPSQLGLSAALLNTAQQVGGALGIAVLSAIATARSQHLLAMHDASSVALTAGFQRALLACGFFLLAAALIALRASNSKGEEPAHSNLDTVPVGATVG